MIRFGSVGSVHSNPKPKTKPNIFGFKNSKSKPNRTENLATVQSVLAGLFGSSVFCTPLSFATSGREFGVKSKGGKKNFCPKLVMKSSSNQSYKQCQHSLWGVSKSPRAFVRILNH